MTEVGAPFRAAVAAITSALGPPIADPTEDTACVGADGEVDWKGFRLASSDGKVSGWSSERPDLTTPSGVTVGTTVATLRRVYGDRLEVFPANPDAGVTFGVQGVAVSGGLSGSSASDQVEFLFNGTCSPP